MTALTSEEARRPGEGTARAGRRADLLRVVLWMTGALVCFSGMAVSIRTLAATLNIFEILSIRNGSGLLILLGLLVARPGLRHGLAPRNMRLHVLRNTVHFAGQSLWAQALLVLPLATVFTLEFTMPAWTVLFATAWLGERLTVSRIGTIVLGFLGVLVIVRPGLRSFEPAALLVLAAAVGFAVTMVTTKKLTADGSTFAILFWMNLMQLPLALLGSDPWFGLKLHGWQFLAVIGVGVSGILSHFCFSNAFRSGDAILVVPLDFLRIPLIAMVGAAFYGEPLNIVVFVGAALIVSGVLWNLLAEVRRPPVASPNRLPLAADPTDLPRYRE
jgi:drug/metabolite transporter (DMT)-like permease